MRALLSAAFLLCLGIHAEADAFGPFALDTSTPGSIVLEGVIDDFSETRFSYALETHPDTRTVVLNSGGGAVWTSLRIADQIHKAGLNTVVRANAICASACSWMFLAGRERELQGKLGVHHFSLPIGEEVDRSAYWWQAIADALGRYGVHPTVLAIMKETPPVSMYFFSQEESVRYRLASGGDARKPGDEFIMPSGLLRLMGQ